MMIEHNLLLVRKIAERYSWNQDDLFQVGTLGLMSAIARYDPEIARFSTYAVWWIRQAICRHIKQCGNTIRLPCYISSLMSQWFKMRDEMKDAAGGIEPSNKEVRAKMVKPARLDLILKAGTVKHVSALTDKCQPARRISSVLRDSIRREAADLIFRTIQQMLSPRSAHIIIGRFGLDGSSPKTLSKLGEELGLCGERVRQIQIEAMALLKDYLGPRFGEEVESKDNA